MHNPFSGEHPSEDIRPLSVHDFMKREIAKGRSQEEAQKAWTVEHRRRIDEADRAFKQGVKTPRQAAPPQPEAPRQPPREEAPRAEEPPRGKTGYHGWIEQEVAKGKTKTQADQSWEEERKRRIKDIETGTRSSPDRAPRAKDVEAVPAIPEEMRGFLKTAVADLRNEVLGLSNADQAAQKLAKMRIRNLFKTIHPDVRKNDTEVEQKLFGELSQAATEILQAYTRPQEVSSRDKTRMITKLEQLEEKL